MSTPGEKRQIPDGEPVDMSEVTLGERYGSEDMYRDMGHCGDGVVYTDSIQSVTLSTDTQPTRVKCNDDGTLDDFCAWDVKYVHFEALDQSQWYATVELNSGEIWQLKFGARNDRAKGYAFAEPIELNYPR